MHDLIINYSLTKYDAKDVYNIDETALFFRTMPRKGLVLGVRAPKSDALKDRITVMAGASMTGEKLPPLIIGKSDQLRGFNHSIQDQYSNDELQPLYYTGNATAWMNRSVFVTYLNKLDNIFKNKGQRILMFCDAPSIHVLGLRDDNGQLLTQTLENIFIFYLPSNLTAVLQPMDQGIIRSLKSKYRYLFTKELCLKALPFLQNDSQNLTTFNLKEFIKTKDAIDLLRTAWYSVESSTIVNCWIKSGIGRYWNLTKQLPTSELIKRAEKQTAEYAKSIFKDPDIHLMFNGFEKEGNFEEEYLKEQLLSASNNEITKLYASSHELVLEEVVVDNSNNLEDVITPNELAFDP